MGAGHLSHAARAAGRTPNVNLQPVPKDRTENRRQPGRTSLASLKSSSSVNNAG